MVKRIIPRLLLWDGMRWGLPRMSIFIEDCNSQLVLGVPELPRDVQLDAGLDIGLGFH